jgi:hypothetical protein
MLHSVATSGRNRRYTKTRNNEIICHATGGINLTGLSLRSFAALRLGEKLTKADMDENSVAKEIVDSARYNRQSIPTVYENIRIDTDSGRIWWSKTSSSLRSIPSS